MSVLLQALGPMLLLYFNQVVGLPAIWVSSVIGITIAVDAVTDLMIGYASDNWRSRWGRRHPFMYFAILPSAVAFYFLFNPPNGWSQESLFVYMVTTMIAIRVLFSFYDLPSTALGAEMTSDYDERTRMTAYRFFFGNISTAVVGYVTYSVFLASTEQYPTGQLNPQGYAAFGLFGAISIIISILIANIGTQHFIPYLHQPEKRKLGPITAGKEVFQTLWNRNYIILLIFGIFSAIYAGIDTSLRLYFTTYFFQLTGEQISSLVIGFLPAPFVAAFISPYLGRKYGKKWTTIGAMLALLFLGFIPLWLWVTGLLPTKDSPWLMVILVADIFLGGMLLMISSIQGASMIFDLTEEIQVKTGRRSEGILFSAGSVAQKMVTGLGAYLAGLMLFWVGFPDKAEPGHVDPAILNHLLYIFLPSSLVLNLLAIGTLSLYSNDRERHEANLRILRDARLKNRGDENAPAGPSLGGSD